MKTTTTSTKARDEYGSRLGTQSAEINAVIIKSRKALTIAELADKTGLSNKRCRDHVDWLVKHDHLEPLRPADYYAFVCRFA